MARSWLLLGIVAAVAGCASARHNGDIDASGGDDVIDAVITTGPDAPPDANNCASQPCDVATQCGCALDHSCDVDTSDLMGGACRPITSPGHETDTCTSLEECDRGYVCIGGATASSCKKYCTSNADCGSPRGQCVIDVSDGTTPIPGIPPVCSSNCDPASPTLTGCPATGWKCGIFNATHMGTDYNIADCAVAGAGVQGSVCTGSGNGNDALCAQNFLCTTVTGAAPYNCRRICTVGGGQCGGLTCLTFATPVIIGGTEYGVCN